MTFDLLMQASGRSGRADSNGEVVIQVFDANQFVIQCVQKQDYIRFFQNEMNFRKAGQYPPYTYLISITVSSTSQTKVDSTALKIKNSLFGNFKVIGVVSLLKIKDRYRSRIILKGKNLAEMRQSIQTILMNEELDLNTIKIDVNPMILD